jgi:hypothetical protein
MTMTQQRISWALWMFTVACLGSVALACGWAVRGPGAPEPRELFAVVERHLVACHSGDYPLAYHASASEVQEKFSLVQYERELRRDWWPLLRRDHVEFGQVRAVRGDRNRATVDVFFVFRRGEVMARRYSLVREEGDWKIDGSWPVAGAPGGVRVRLAGIRA